MYNNGDKAKQHTPFNSSVYSPLNKCDFIPDCAYELPSKSTVFPNGFSVDVYRSDNNKHFRAVLFDKYNMPIAGILYERKGKVIYGEVAEGFRKQGLYKHLRLIAGMLSNVNLWSEYQSEALLERAFHKQQ